MSRCPKECTKGQISRKVPGGPSPQSMPHVTGVRGLGGCRGSRTVTLCRHRPFKPLSSKQGAKLNCLARLTSCTRQLSLSCLPPEVPPLLLSQSLTHIVAGMRLFAPAAAVPNTVPRPASALTPAHFSWRHCVPCLTSKGSSTFLRPPWVPTRAGHNSECHRPDASGHLCYNRRHTWPHATIV